MAKLKLSLVWAVVAVAGCGTRAALIVHDAGSPRDSVGQPDTATRDDGFVARDVLVAADAFPDGFVQPEPPADGPDARADAAREAAPELSMPPDVAADTAARDLPVEYGLRDLVPPDENLAGDLPRPDSASEMTSLEVGSPDRAPMADLAGAREVPPFAVDGALASFCSGDVAHMLVNGIESNPTVTGRMIPYDCCDGGEFHVTTETFSYPIVVPWRRMAGSAFRYPAAVDLASAPSDWSIRLVAGCDPMLSSCTGPGDSYTSGLEGELQVDRSGSQFDMSLCLHVAEPASSPHPLIHALDLYAPHVLTTY